MALGCSGDGLQRMNVGGGMELHRRVRTDMVFVRTSQWFIAYRTPLA